MRALVTGGTGRIGSAVAERLTQSGWSVFAAGRGEGDLSSAEAARALVERAVEELGGLDLLVNAAAEGFVAKPIGELTESDWDRGVVIMVEDVASYEPWPSFAAHCAAKAAQAMLTRVFARALAPEVRVCGVAPGPVAVVQGQEERRAAETLLGRIGSPEDVAEAVLYLADAGFVTGTSLFVDGGRHLQTVRAPGA